MDELIRSGQKGAAFDKDRAAFEHAFDLFELRIDDRLGSLRKNADTSMLKAAAAARSWNDTLPNEQYYIHESSPNAEGTGKEIDTHSIPQFPGDEPDASNPSLAENRSVGNGRMSEIDIEESGHVDS